MHFVIIDVEDRTWMVVQQNLNRSLGFNVSEIQEQIVLFILYEKNKMLACSSFNQRKVALYTDVQVVFCLILICLAESFEACLNVCMR